MTEPKPKAEKEGSVMNETLQLLPRSLQWTDYNWGRIDAGDCTMHYANLTLYSDGLAEFRSAVATDSSGDVWLVKSLELIGPLGDVLYTIPQFNGPQMQIEDYNYPFNRFRDINPLTFPAQIYPTVKSVRMTYHC